MTTSFKSSDLRSRLFRNIGANAYGQLISIGIQLVSVPLFLHFWGVQLYGEWLILSAIPAYLSLSDIGFASVAANDMTMRTAKGDRAGAIEVYQSIWLLISATSAILGGITCLLVWNLPLTRLFAFQHIRPDQVCLALTMLLAYVLIGLQAGVLSAGFRCSGRYAYGTIVNNTVRLTEWASAVCLLALGGTVVHVASALLLVRSLGTILLWLALRRQSPWLALGFRQARTGTIKRLVKPALAFMAFPLGLAFSIQGMLLVIGIGVGPAAVAIFTAYRTLTRLLIQMMTLLSQAVWPEISAAYGAGAFDVVGKLHQKGSAIAFWLGLAGVLCIGLGGDMLIGIWTRHAFAPNSVLLGLLLMTGFLNILWQTSWVLLMATNRHQKISLVFVASAVAGLAASLAFFPYLGIDGAGLALILAELPMLIFAINGGLDIVKSNWPDYVRAIVGAPFKRQPSYS